MKCVPCSGPGCGDLQTIEVGDHHVGPAFCSIECAVYGGAMSVSGNVKLEAASQLLTAYLREKYRCWLAVGMKQNSLVVYYDEKAVPGPFIPDRWEGFVVEAKPTGIPVLA